MGGDGRAANLLGCLVSLPAEVGVYFCLNETHCIFRTFGEHVCSHGDPVLRAVGCTQTWGLGTLPPFQD